MAYVQQWIPDRAGVPVDDPSEACRRIRCHHDIERTVVAVDDRGRAHRRGVGGEPAAQEIELAEQLIKKLAAPFQPDRYQDEYRKHLLELVEAKSAGKRIEGEPKRRKAPVIDLMQALQKSLSQSAAAKKPAAHARGSKPSRARRASRG